MKIDNESELLFLIHLSRSLENLANYRGFVEHVNEFSIDKDSTYFVTTLADYLTSRSKTIELEPVISNHPKQADIRIDFDETELFIECKNPKKDILTGAS